MQTLSLATHRSSRSEELELPQQILEKSIKHIHGCIFI